MLKWLNVEWMLKWMKVWLLKDANGLAKLKHQRIISAWISIWKYIWSHNSNISDRNTIQYLFQVFVNIFDTNWQMPSFWSTKRDANKWDQTNFETWSTIFMTLNYFITTLYSFSSYNYPIIIIWWIIIVARA